MRTNGLFKEEREKRCREHRHVIERINDIEDQFKGDDNFSRGVRLGHVLGRMEMDFILGLREISILREKKDILRKVVDEINNIISQIPVERTTNNNWEELRYSIDVAPVVDFLMGTKVSLMKMAKSESSGTGLTTKN